MISLKRKQAGFTIVELLIVIVVIGILAAIVITTFTGVQRKGRDADRRSDIASIAAQAEVYFAENSRYPSLADLNDSTWRDANVKGLSADVTQPPNSTQPMVASAGSATDRYQYVTVPSACDSDATSATLPDCTDFTLTANLENGGTFSKDGAGN